MLAYTYIKQGLFELVEKPKPQLLNDRDAIVKVTLGSICTSDLHIKHGSVPRAVPASPWAMRWWASWTRWGKPSPPSGPETG